MMVARVWQRAGLKPHRIERYMASDDPDFELKAADIIGLYVKPPQHAAVFCVDEKTAIQALDRLDPVLPLSPGRLERHGFEYYRHGTLSLYAALNTRNGEVVGKTAAHHTSQEFVAFLAEVVANQPRGKEIHLIADNLSAHKTSGLRNSSRRTPKCISTTPRPTPPGSIRLKTGSPGSSAMSLPEESSPRSRTWPVNLSATSVTTIAPPSPSSGPIATPTIASMPIPLHLLQATRYLLMYVGIRFEKD
jgi:hypothetical protein